MRTPDLPLLLAPAFVLAVGCKSTDRPYQKIDRPAEIPPAAKIQTSPAVVRAKKDGDLLPTTLFVVRVEKVDIALGEGFAFEAIPDDHREMFRRRLIKAGGITGTAFYPSMDIEGRPTLDDLLRTAGMDGSKLLLVYEHKTPVTLGRELIYRKVFHSRARAAVISVATGEVLFTAEGDCEGTIGGLTPLQMSLHPHVEPAAKRQAVNKLAEVVRDTLDRIREGAPGPATATAAAGRLARID
jgi:hypothetical protein